MMDRKILFCLKIFPVYKKEDSLLIGQEYAKVTRISSQ
jgi:hypothetical protein